MEGDNNVVKSMLAELDDEEDDIEDKTSSKENSPEQAKYAFYSGTSDAFGALQQVRASSTSAPQDTPTALHSTTRGQNSAHNSGRRNGELEEESSEDEDDRNQAEKFAGKGINLDTDISSTSSNGPSSEAYNGDGAKSSSMSRPRQEAESLRKFVHEPAHTERFRRCCIIRKKHFVGDPTFYVYLEKDNTYLMCAQKRKKNKTSNYLITLEKEPTTRDSPLNLGKLRGNWTGEQYTIYDHGLSYEDTASTNSLRKELGLVHFAYANSGPGKLSVFLPRVSSSGHAATIRPSSEKETISSRVLTEGEPNFEALQNKLPHWNERTQSYVLDFHGRVKKASIKNFQLAQKDDNKLVLQFGKVDKDRFIMDLRHPLSIFQAFSIVLSTLDAKIADTAAYSKLRDSQK